MIRNCIISLTLNASFVDFVKEVSPL